MTDYWSVEIRRILWVLGAAFTLGWLTEYWLASLLGVLFVYIGWMMYKLRQLQRWLIRGSKPSRMPDSDGAWEQIVYLIHKTQQKSADRKKKQSELLMRFNNILSALPDAAILLGKDNEIQWVNKSAPLLLHIHERNDLGQRVDNLVRNPELQRVLHINSSQPVRFSPAHNEDMTLEASILPVQSGLRLLHVRDISQGIRLQRTRKAFIANASHELRTPLTVLMGYIELFQHDPDLPPHLLQALHQSYEQTTRMQQIIQDMLELSRLENLESTPLRGVDINMPELLENTLKAVQDTLAANSHTLEMLMETDLHISGVEKDITSVVTNLITNAVKHTPHGTHIQVRWRERSSGHVCLSVEDNGLGIPREHLQHLTERFYRVDTGRSRESGGTGLGLAIVKHVMKWHDGYLTIRSRPGQTRFQACFPPSRVKRP